MLGFQRYSESYDESSDARADHGTDQVSQLSRADNEEQTTDPRHFYWGLTDKEKASISSALALVPSLIEAALEVLDDPATDIEQWWLADNRALRDVLKGHYRDILRRLERGVSFVSNDDVDAHCEEKEAAAYVKHSSGWFYPRIFVKRATYQRSPEFLAEIVVHELAHLATGASDWVYFDVLSGVDYKDAEEGERLTAEQMLSNADTYSEFAGEAKALLAGQSQEGRQTRKITLSGIEFTLHNASERDVRHFASEHNALLANARRHLGALGCDYVDEDVSFWMEKLPQIMECVVSTHSEIYIRHQFEDIALNADGSVSISHGDARSTTVEREDCEARNLLDLLAHHYYGTYYSPSGITLSLYLGRKGLCQD